MTVKGLPRTQYENRKFFYEDIENLLVQGFLTHKVVLGGTIFHLRSIAPYDYFHIDKRLRNDSFQEWRYSLLASSLWNIDGYSFLEFPQHFYVQRKIYDRLKRLPKVLVEKLYFTAIALTQRANKAISDIEYYCLEDISYLMWKQSKKEPQLFSGSPTIGLNTAQKIWIYFNEVEDKKEVENLHWEHAKFLASASAPEGVKKLQNSENTRKEAEVDAKQNKLDFFYYHKIGFLSAEDYEKRSEIKGVKQAYSIEELEDEYIRWVRGEKDEHDLIVDAYKEQIKQRYEDQKKQREEELVALRQFVEKKQDEMKGGTQLVGLRPDEVFSYLEKKGVSSGGVRKIHDNDPFTYKETIANKYLNVEEVNEAFDKTTGEFKVKISSEEQQLMLEAYKNATE